jgi:periplasmic protein TonB
MKPELILQADILDIIFEDRNKEYGAYNLRKNYDRRMMKAMSGVVILVAIIFVMNSGRHSDNKYSSFTGIISDTVILDPAPVVDPPPVIEPPKPKMATIENPSFVLSNDSVTDSFPTIDDLNKPVAIGLRTQDGDSTLSNISPPEEPKGTSAEIARVEPPKETNEIVDHPDFMPEFPGGQAAFMRFLSKNLKAPEEGMQPGQKIRILVRFVVGKDGELSNVQFMETGGEVFEQEVMRVMKKMPRWKPGRQNGQNVSVYFKLPVVFEMPGE